jgi:signal transduction histidine kinase
MTGKEHNFRKKSGDVITGLLSSAVTKVNGKEIILSNIYDITKRKEKEIRLLEHSEELQAAKDSKDKFFSIIAHDLRSPFQALLSISELLFTEAESLAPSDIKQMSHGLNTALQKQYGLLNDLLDWSRLQSDSFSLVKETAILSELVAEVIGPLTIAASGKEIKIINNIPDDLTVNADLNMLKLVIRNLVGNSIKFTNPGGAVSISAEKSNEEIIVSVCDNGIGISPEDLPKLFSAGMHFSTAGTMNEAGSGLGLVLCGEIIEKHGGKIFAESKAGMGSKFSFTLPLL